MLDGTRSYVLGDAFFIQFIYRHYIFACVVTADKGGIHISASFAEPNHRHQVCCCLSLTVWVERLASDSPVSGLRINRGRLCDLLLNCIHQMLSALGRWKRSNNNMTPRRVARLSGIRVFEAHEADEHP